MHGKGETENSITNLLKTYGVILVLILTLLLFYTDSIKAESTQNRSDWPQFRNDSNHTGYQQFPGNGDISKYGIKWYKSFGESNNNHNLIYGEASVADIDLDGEKEIIFGLEDGRLICLKPNGDTKWEYDSSGTISSTPTFVDIDNNSNIEIIFTDRSGKISVLSNKGKLIWDFQTEDMIDASAAVGDITGDGNLDIVIGSLDKNIYVLTKDGNLIWKYDTGYWIEDAAAIVDINNDDQNDIIVGNGNGILYAITTEKTIEFENIPKLRRVKYSPKILWQFETKQINNIGYTNSPVIVDINYDGKLEVIAGAADGNIYCLNENGKELWRYNAGSTIDKTPAVADINNDGVLEIVFGAGELLIVIDSNGSYLWQIEFNMRVVTNPVILDINNDDFLEIATIDKDMEAIGPEMSRNKWINSTNIINYKGEIIHKLKFFEEGYNQIYGVSAADLENDGKLEILVGTYEGYIYCYGEIETPINNNDNKDNDKNNNSNENNNDNKDENNNNSSIPSFDSIFILFAFLVIIIKKLELIKK